MAIDDRIRQGLRRSMSSIDADAERHLGEARRRGHRRLVIRRAVVAIVVAAGLAVVVVAGPGLRDLLSDQGQGPAVQQAPAASTSGSTPKPILGIWRMQYSCATFVQALEQAGVGEFAAKSLVAFRMQPGPADKLASSADLCRGARDIRRTHVFHPNGYLLTYQGQELVDHCRCSKSIGNHAIVILGDPGDPDVSLRYRVEADTLTFTAVMPEPCSSVNCRDQFAFAVSQFAVGTWRRVN